MLGMRRDPLSGGIQQNFAASGQKRYGLNGSASATQGSVDPAGYQDREARRKQRRDALNRRMRMESQGSISTPLGGL